MRTHIQACYRAGIFVILVLAYNGCSPEKEASLDQATQVGPKQKAAYDGASASNREAESEIGNGNLRTPTGDPAELEDNGLEEDLGTKSPVASHDGRRGDGEPTIISAEGLRPVSEEELLNHPLMRELARRREAEIQGVDIKYDYGGAFGIDGIADGALAYVDGRLAGEARALRLVGNTPSTIEVEVKHYSPSGEIVYRGITLFVVGNVWKPGDDPVLPGAPLSRRDIEGSTDRPLFSRWPVGGPF